MILNLGSGRRPIEGAVNLDNKRLPGVDWIFDLENTIKIPLPFRDNTFSEVKAFHIMEHIRNFIPLMNELHRVCKIGARIRIDVPHYTNPLFYDDPTHVRSFSSRTFCWMCLPENAELIGLKAFNLIASVFLGEPYNKEKPTVVAAELEVLK